jgi:hypothetical protein
MKNYLTFLMVVIVLLKSPAQDHSEMVPYLKNGKWGYETRDLKPIIVCKYQMAWPFFKTGKAVVKFNNRYGMINVKGEVIMPFAYKEIDQAAVYEHLHRAVKNSYGGEGFINEDGKEVISCSYSSFLIIGGCDNNYFCSGIAYANSGTLPIDTSGIILQSQLPGNIGLFYNGTAPVTTTNSIGFIDIKGKTIIRVINYIGNEWSKIKDGYIMLSDTSGNYGYVDTKGKVVVPFKYKSAKEFSNGLAAVEINNKWGFVNEQGKVVIPIEFDLVTDFYSDRAYVVKNSEKMLINKLGEKKLDLTSYNDVNTELKYGILNVMEHDSDWKFINTEGKLINSGKYSSYAENLWYLKWNYVTVERNGRIGCIDASGKEFIPCLFKRVRQMNDSLFAVADSLWNWGVCNRNGKFLIPCKYSFMNDNPINNLLQVVVQSKKGPDKLVTVSRLKNEKTREFVKEILYEREGFVDLNGKEYF